MFKIRYPIFFVSVNTSEMQQCYIATLESWLLEAIYLRRYIQHIFNFCYLYPSLYVKVMIKKINCTEKKKSGSYITHLSMNWALIELLFASRLGTSSNKKVKTSSTVGWELDGIEVRYHGKSENLRRLLIWAFSSQRGIPSTWAVWSSHRPIVLPSWPPAGSQGMDMRWVATCKPNCHTLHWSQDGLHPSRPQMHARLVI